MFAKEWVKSGNIWNYPVNATGRRAKYKVLYTMITVTLYAVLYKELGGKKQNKEMVRAQWRTRATPGSKKAALLG